VPDAGALARELAATRTALADAVAAHQAFAYSVSHDLRAPLRAIAGFAGLLAESAPADGDDAGRLLGLIRENVQVLNTQIDALLTLSRLAHRGLRTTAVDMTAAAQSAVDSLRRRHPERAVAVDVGALPPAHADPELVDEIFEALLDNAWKFTRTTPRPAIAIGSTDATYFVRDNGVGFAPQAADRLFTVFRRLHRADEFEGLGLGLAVVRTIVGRHGGRVAAECNPGVATTFSFTLAPHETTVTPPTC